VIARGQRTGWKAGTAPSSRTNSASARISARSWRPAPTNQAQKFGRRRSVAPRPPPDSNGDKTLPACLPATAARSPRRRARSSIATPWSTGASQSRPEPRFEARRLLRAHDGARLAGTRYCHRRRCQLGRARRPCSLAETAKRVHILIRSGGLAQTMSRDLRAHRRRIRWSICTRANRDREYVRDTASRTDRLRTGRDGPVPKQTDPARLHHDRAEPSDRSGSPAAWRSTPKGFIKTGPALTSRKLAAAHWPLPPRPTCSRPVWCACVRGGLRAQRSVKRAASAVGKARRDRRGAPVLAE